MICVTGNEALGSALAPHRQQQLPRGLRALPELDARRRLLPTGGLHTQADGRARPIRPAPRRAHHPRV